MEEAKKGWQDATIGKVGHVMSRQEQVRAALEDLENKEKDRIAAQIAEQQRQQARADALERKRQRDAWLRAEEERKQMLAKELQERRDELAQHKADEKTAVKEATKAFNKKREMDHEARVMSLRMKAMNNVIQQVGLTSSKCLHEGRMKFCSTKVCEMRLSMRETRPQPELFRDEVDEALEKELLILNGAREELQQCAKAGEQVKSDILEVQSLLITGNSRENVKERVAKIPINKCSSLPSLVGNLSGAPSQKDLLARGAALTEKAQAIDAKSNEVLTRTTEDCNKAAARVAACFTQRSSETGELKKNLAMSKKEISATINQAERRLLMLRMRLHKTPETPRSEESTKEQMKQVEDLIKELRYGKASLDEDYRHKTSAFKVDRSCINLTKIKAGGHTDKKKVTVETVEF